MPDFARHDAFFAANSCTAGRLPGTESTQSPDSSPFPDHRPSGTPANRPPIRPRDQHCRPAARIRPATPPHRGPSAAPPLPSVAFGTRSRVDIAQAEALETEALDFPEERGEILQQAAEAWQRAGRPERAREILAGDDACYAQVQLAELDFSDGAAEAARARLAALAKDRALDETHCVLAAELLAEHGDLVRAARWYDRAAARFAEDEMDALRGHGGDVSLATVMVLRNRRHVREQLGRVRRVAHRHRGQAPVLRERPGARHDRLAAGTQRRLLVRLGAQVQAMLRSTRLAWPGASGRSETPHRIRTYPGLTAGVDFHFQRSTP